MPFTFDPDAYAPPAAPAPRSGAQQWLGGDWGVATNDPNPSLASYLYRAPISALAGALNTITVPARGVQTLAAGLLRGGWAPGHSPTAAMLNPDVNEGAAHEINDYILGKNDNPGFMRGAADIATSVLTDPTIILGAGLTKAGRVAAEEAALKLATLTESGIAGGAEAGIAGGAEALDAAAVAKNLAALKGTAGLAPSLGGRMLAGETGLALRNPASILTHPLAFASGMVGSLAEKAGLTGASDAANALGAGLRRFGDLSYEMPGVNKALGAGLEALEPVTSRLGAGIDAVPLARGAARFAGGAARLFQNPNETQAMGIMDFQARATGHVLADSLQNGVKAMQGDDGTYRTLTGYAHDEHIMRGAPDALGRPTGPVFTPADRSAAMTLAESMQPLHPDRLAENAHAFSQLRDMPHAILKDVTDTDFEGAAKLSAARDHLLANPQLWDTAYGLAQTAWKRQVWLWSAAKERGINIPDLGAEFLKRPDVLLKAREFHTAVVAKLTPEVEALQQTRAQITPQLEEADKAKAAIPGASGEVKAGEAIQSGSAPTSPSSVAAPTVFHGATQPFDVGAMKTPAYFTSDRRVAEEFAASRAKNAGEVAPTPRIIQAQLDMQHPLVIDAQGEFAGNLQFGPKAAQYRAALSDPSYDGIIIKNTKDEGDVYIAKTAKQIRSTPADVRPISAMPATAQPTVDWQPGVDKALALRAEGKTYTAIAKALKSKHPEVAQALSEGMRGYKAADIDEVLSHESAGDSLKALYGQEPEGTLTAGQLNAPAGPGGRERGAPGNVSPEARVDARAEDPLEALAAKEAVYNKLKQDNPGLTDAQLQRGDVGQATVLPASATPNVASATPNVAAPVQDVSALRQQAADIDAKLAEKAATLARSQAKLQAIETELPRAIYRAKNVPSHMSFTVEDSAKELIRDAQTGAVRRAAGTGNEASKQRSFTWESGGKHDWLGPDKAERAAGKSGVPMSSAEAEEAVKKYGTAATAGMPAVGDISGFKVLKTLIANPKDFEAEIAKARSDASAFIHRDLTAATQAQARTIQRTATREAMGNSLVANFALPHQSAFTAACKVALGTEGNVAQKLEAAEKAFHTANEGTGAAKLNFADMLDGDKLRAMIDAEKPGDFNAMVGNALHGNNAHGYVLRGSGDGVDPIYNRQPYFVPEALNTAINQYNQMMSPASGPIWDTVTAAMRPFVRVWQLGNRVMPSYHIRNQLQDLLLMGQKGILSERTPEFLGSLPGLLTGRVQPEEWSAVVNGTKVDGNWVLDQFYNRTGMLGKGHYQQLMAEPIGTASKADTVGHFLETAPGARTVMALKDYAGALSATREDVNRGAALLSLLDKGDVPEIAAMKVERALYDYSRVSPAAQFLRQTGLAPFVAWSAKNIPAQAAWAAENPGLALAAARGMSSIAGGVPEQLVSQQLKEKFNINTGYGKDPQTGKPTFGVVTMDGLLPFADLTELAKAPLDVVRQNLGPLARLLSEVADRHFNPEKATESFAASIGRKPVTAIEHLMAAGQPSNPKDPTSLRNPSVPAVLGQLISPVKYNEVDVEQAARKSELQLKSAVASAAKALKDVQIEYSVAQTVGPIMADKLPGIQQRIIQAQYARTQAIAQMQTVTAQNQRVLELARRMGMAK